MTDLETATQSTAILSNRLYDILKALVQLWLPASAVLYLTLAAIWGLPNPEAVAATSVALATFGGVVLRISTKSYREDEGNYDGIISVTSPTPDSTLYSLEINGDPADLQNKEQVNFKISTNGGALRE